MPEPVYLGDAVYGSITHDGTYLALHIDNHQSAPVVYLDRNVLRAVVRYAVEHHLLPFSPAITAPPAPSERNLSP